MSHSGSILAARRSSTVRQLKLLVSLLIFSNIALGAFGFYSLRTIDRKYSRLIKETVPALNDLEELASASVMAMRNTNPIFYGVPSQSRNDLASQAHNALARLRQLRERIAERELALLPEDDLKKLRDAGDQFEGEADRVVALLESGRDADAQATREKALRPMFERYLAEVTKTARRAPIQESSGKRDIDRADRQLRQYHARRCRLAALRSHCASPRHSGSDSPDQGIPSEKRNSDLRTKS